MAQGRAVGVSLTQQLAKLEKQLSGIRDQFLIEISEEVVATSPVWSGRYVASHSINNKSSAGQFTQSIEGMTEKTTSPDAYRAEGRANLMSDIKSLPKDVSLVYLNNNAPHAQIVESGGWASGRPPYKVYARVVARAGIHMANAIAKVKGGR